MAQQFPLDNLTSPPPNKIKGWKNATDIPILDTLKQGYLLWHNFLPHLLRLSRYTLGIKIDELFIDILELTHTAQYTRREDKLTFLQLLNRKFDNLKFFITLLWEVKGLDEAKFAQLARKLSSVGIMLGGWINKLSLPKQTPPA